MTANLHRRLGLYRFDAELDAGLHWYFLLPRCSSNTIFAMLIDMNKIYPAKFGEKTVRFVLPKDSIDVFVCQQDILAILKDSCTPDIFPVFDPIFNQAIADFADEKDRRAAILELKTIGRVVHAHAMSNILDVLGDLHATKNQGLRESSFRFNTVFRWYRKAFVLASNDFGLSLMDTMTSVKSRLDRVNPPHIVNVSHEDNMWIAECDTFGLVTEAATYDQLTERVWELVPVMIEANGLEIDAESIRLSFQHIETASRQYKVH